MWCAQAAFDAEVSQINWKFSAQSLNYPALIAAEQKIVFPSYRMLGGLALLISSSVTLAGPWSGKLGLGLIATSGNSQASTFNLEAALNHQRGIWQNGATASALRARSTETDAAGVVRNVTTAERYVAGLRTALDFSDYDYVFARVDFEKDLFGGVRERMTETIGYGRRLLNTSAHKLDIELGGGVRQLLAQQTGARRESGAVGRAGLKYAWKITDSSHFGQRLTVEAGDKNTYTESASELKMAVIGGVFANLAFTSKHNSDVPVGTKRTDTISSVSLSYEF